jgi:hypothetical protein
MLEHEQLEAVTSKLLAVLLPAATSWELLVRGVFRAAMQIHMLSLLHQCSQPAACRAAAAAAAAAVTA